MFFFIAKFRTLKIHCHHFPNLFDPFLMKTLGASVLQSLFGEMLTPPIAHP